MRSIATTIFLATLGLGVVGCGSKATTGAVDTASRPVNDQDKAGSPIREQEDKTKRIADMKSAWEDVRDTKDNGNGGWLQEAKGFSKDAVDTCTLADRFQEALALYSSIETYPGDASAAELPTSSEIRARVLVGLTKQYLKAFSLAAIKGSMAPCRGTEGNTEGLPFGADDLERLLDAMDSVHITPSDAGTTTTAIRTLHLNLVRRDMPDLKQRIADENGDAIGYLQTIMKDWHYTAKDLGLTAAEMAKINPPADPEK